jgi:hypothetical protein
VEGVTQRAEELLAQVPGWIWDGTSLPVPVEDIADSHCGLLVRDVEDMTQAPGCPPIDGDQTISGLLLPSRGEIWVNAEEAREWPPRRRFTIGHELGHWVLHQRGQASLFCRHGTVDPDEGEQPERPPLDPIEEEANWFAASLLMPAPLVRRHYERTGGDFQALCRIFNCSGAAMGRRLHQVI